MKIHSFISIAYIDSSIVKLVSGNLYTSDILTFSLFSAWQSLKFAIPFLELLELNKVEKHFMNSLYPFRIIDIRNVFNHQ